MSGETMTSGGGRRGNKRPRTCSCTRGRMTVRATALLVTAAGALTPAASAAELVPPLPAQTQAQVGDMSMLDSSGYESVPVPAAGHPCDWDNPAYQSRLGLSCSEHVAWFDPSQMSQTDTKVGNSSSSATKSSPCETYALVGFAPDQVAELKWHCPRSCGVFESSVDASCWRDGVEDGDDRSSNTYLLHHAGLSDDDPDHVVDILHFSSSLAVGDGGDSDGDDSNIRGRRHHRQLQRSCYPGWSRTCQDDVSYFSKLRAPCWRHTKLDCTAFGNIGYTDEEILDLVESCPCSCGVECGTYSVAPSASPSVRPSAEPTMMPSASPSLSLAPSADPTGHPTQSPSDAPSSSPTKAPTRSPTKAPTRSPTSSPTASPSASPSSSPSASPSASPSNSPSASPSSTPSVSPSSTPSMQPTKGPSPSPSSSPTASPTHSPSDAPSSSPTTKRPSPSPSSLPTANPTHSPTDAPSSSPTIHPSSLPSLKPSASPTKSFPPSQGPTVGPDLISWTTTESGLLQEDRFGWTTESGLLKGDRFGWNVMNKGLTLSFAAEKSENCFEGKNINEQKGTATARLSVPEGKRLFLNYTLGGIGESLDTGYEEMILYINGIRMASSTSQALGIDCSTSPAVASYAVEPPYLLRPGRHQLRIDFTTFDDFDHYGIEYMINFDFL